jgi:hypothetical protein
MVGVFPPRAAASWRSVVGCDSEPLYPLASRRRGKKVDDAPQHPSCLGRAVVASYASPVEQRCLYRVWGQIHDHGARGWVDKVVTGQIRRISGEGCCVVRDTAFSACRDVGGAPSVERRDFPLRSCPHGGENATLKVGGVVHP